jgi:hypothetical protein
MNTYFATSEMGGGKSLYINHLRKLLVSISAFTVIAVMFFANAISLKADSEPCNIGEPYYTLCETVRVEQFMITQFGCESVDPPPEQPCAIEVELCVRFYMVGTETVKKSEIKGVKLTNCNSECNQYIWEGALITVVWQNDVSGEWNTYDFIYQAATCWKPIPWSTTHVVSYGYESCDVGECCVGFYHITRELVGSNKVITIEFVSRLTRMTHYCTPPCTFTNCESTSPEGTITFNKDDLVAFYPKISTPETSFDNALFLSPNPVDEKIDIRIINNARENMFVRIYDNNGLLVYEQSLGNVFGETNFQVNTSGFSVGMYNVVVLSDLDVLYNKSFVKIN